jgi:putative two-component system response regulator
MKTVFIVDDIEANLMIAKNALEGKYEVYAVSSAEKMLELVRVLTPNLILLDVDMPGMDGFEAMAALKADERLRTIPVIFLTAMNDEESEIRGFEMGALDFVTKPFSPHILLRRIETHLEIDKLIKEGQRALRMLHNATISVTVDMVESRDQVTGGHIERTQAYLELLINELKRTGNYIEEMADWDLSILLPSAQLHDLGKIVISDMVLNKPGKLTEEEFEMIKRHVAEGERIIERIIEKTTDDGFLRHAKLFAGFHHEKWNGTGYPRKLTGTDIPLEGRIMAIADVYDALVSERPYKQPFSHEEAVEIIKNERGTHFDPVLVDAFLNVADEFHRVASKMG